MGVSVFPPVSTASARKWVELYSATPTASSSITVSGLAAYPYYRIVLSRIQFAGAGTQCFLRLNGDTSANNYINYESTANIYVQTWGWSLLTEVTAAASDQLTTDCIISYADAVSPKQLSMQTFLNAATDKANMNRYSLYLSNSQISSMEFANTVATTFSTVGNISIYGSLV